MNLRLPAALLCAATAAMACQNFPAGFVPFSSIYYVSAPNVSGDRLVVGVLADPSLGAVNRNLPLPLAVNDTYCNTQVQLGPNASYYNVYVPTTPERSGNFNAFAGLLLDPLANNQPFPNGMIPQSRLGGIYAFRIGSQTPPPGSTGPLQVSSQQLQFTSVQGGNTPAPQTVAVTSTTTPLGFSVQIDGGAGIAAPPWITATPLSGTTPATLTISVKPGPLPPGTYNAHVHVAPVGTSGITTVDIAVTLTVTSAPPQITVAPGRLQFTAPFGTSSVQEQSLLVRASGGGSTSFSAAVLGKSSWITDVTPSSGTSVLDLPVILRVHVNPTGLAIGTYSDVIRLTAGIFTTDVPVSLLVRNPGPVIKLGATGLLFEIRQGSGSADLQNIPVLNTGDPGSTVSFTATLLTGSDWAVLGVPKNQATTTSPGMLTFQVNPNAATFSSGTRTALVQVTDSRSQNSPQYLTAVLQVDPANASAPPDPSPAGVFMIATAAKPAPASPVVLNYSSANLTNYQTSVSTLNGGSWLSVSPVSGQVSTAKPANLTVSASSYGLKTGIYAGTVSVYIGSVVRTIHATLVVLPGAAGVTIPATRDAATCVPQQLVLVQTELADNFAVTAGFPAFLSIQANDDCGNPVLDASVVASFDNGDPPLRLDSDNATGFYSATWSPGHVFPGMTVTFDATEPNLLSPAPQTSQSTPASNLKGERALANGVFGSSAGASRLSGSVVSNSTPIPVLAAGGTVNNVNPVLSAPLAPGTIAAVYGSNLATTTAQTPGAPLPTQFQGTSVRTGNFAAPLYYVDGDQLDIQIPFELAPNQTYPILVTVNGLSSVPDTFTVAPATPAIAAYSDGTVKGQHADASLITASSPAKAGEVVTIYLIGMGAVSPPVASGAASPSSPLSTVAAQVTVGGQPATVQFAGLTPGFVGLYQINFTVPSGTQSGNANLVVTQSGFNSNPVTLPVSR